MNETYLVHHGIKGQHWGVRRFQNEDGSLKAAGEKRYKVGSAQYYQSKADRAAAKVLTSKTRLGKSINNYKAYRNETNANRERQLSRDGVNILKIGDSLHGHGANAAKQKAAANYYARKAEYTATKRGTTVAKAASYNNQQAAKLNTKLHNAKSIKEYGSTLVKGSYNMPIKTMSGRKTTVGKEALANMISGGLLNATLDAKYYRTQNNEKGTIGRKKQAKVEARQVKRETKITKKRTAAEQMRDMNRTAAENSNNGVMKKIYETNERYYDRRANKYK